MRRAYFAILVPAVGLAACADLREPAAPDVAPSFSVTGAGIPDHYIVVLRAGVDPVSAAAQLAGAHGGQVGFTYTAALRGFSARLSPQAASALSRNPSVAYIEQDQVVSIGAVQSNATWGLDRIDQRARPVDGLYHYNATGSGVRAYIVDTGIRRTHNDFGGRAVAGFDAIGDGRNGDDCNGHGTHVAGTVGGTTWGVAKQVSLVTVRVLNCNGSGTTSGVIAGVDWVTANHVKPAVANMSLGGGASTALDDAVRNSIAAGVGYAVAAGNGDFLGRQQNACNYSPARVTEAITVGATTNTDSKASWSNYGNCVDLFAPGVGITSAWHSSNTATNTISGTSMASPHVAGVAALYLQGSPGASPLTVRNAIYDASTKGIVTNSSTANNHLLYSLFVGGGDPAPNTPPTASFTFSCSGLTCSFTDTSTDADGSIAAWAWTFGDGGSSSQQNPSRTYAAAGTYTVGLTVTDNGGLTGSTSQSVTVSSSGEPPPSTFTLTATGYKVQGIQRADLGWSGTSASQIDVYRDNVRITTVANTGAYTDNIGVRGPGSYTYRVCEAGTSVCSNNAAVNF